MSIQIYPPVCLHEKGHRSNNEDAIYPTKGAATTTDRLFLVCDGVGGANKGEVASQLTCDLFQAYFAEHIDEVVDEAFVTNALKFTEQKLDAHKNLQPECTGMATTLTLIYFDDMLHRAVISWSGDSRIYHIRDGKILFQSEDHSLVNELVKRGEITEEEAYTHPRRNVILRAISGMDNPTKADTYYAEDVQAGDYFFLATDGILESIDNSTLEILLQSEDVDLSQVASNIKQLCEMGSNDNYSMYLLQVSELEESTEKLPGTAKNTIQSIALPPKIDENPSVALDRSNKKWMYILGTVALFLLLALGVFQWNKLNEKNAYQAKLDKATKQEQENDLVAAIVTYQQAKDNFPKLAKRANLQNKISGLQVEIKAQEQRERDDLISGINYILTDSTGNGKDQLLAELDSVKLNDYEDFPIAELKMFQEEIDSIQSNLQQAKDDSILKKNE
ncbi:MAG: PP2C family protein-serine/threonine phosphatase [Chitinophagales bacterium]